MTQKISAFNNINELATALNTSKLNLMQLAYSRNNYKTIYLNKKNSLEKREIQIPNGKLKLVQRNLAVILDNSYTAHRNAHGFIKEKSIVTNARPHSNKKYVLNLDLKNFFTNITFGRVRSLFLNYFKMSPNLSTILANLCCYYEGDNRAYLPQGAPTSPIISNILTNTLDRNLARYCNHHDISYTRYVDDLTFSFNNYKNNGLVHKNLDTNEIRLTKFLKTHIESAGFYLNEDKVYLRSYYEHQEVTGLVVNKKVNINRKYIRNIRAILHSIKQAKPNLSIAEQKFIEEYTNKNNNYINMFEILKGRISFIKQIRGYNDFIYLNLASEFNDILADVFNNNYDKTNYTEMYKRIQQIKTFNLKNMFENNTFIVETPLTTGYCKITEELIDIDGSQGTLFLLQSIGLITNYHVVESAIKFKENIHYYNSKNIQVHYEAKVIYWNEDKDIAILKSIDSISDNTGYDFSLTERTDSQPVTLVGFPTYQEMDNVSIIRGHITTVKSSHMRNERFRVSSIIYAGNSGGPVLNNTNEVIGIAARGLVPDSNPIPSEVIPIADVIQVFKNKERVFSTGS